MLHILFTLDYEIHGNGEGCSRQLMVAPTERMLKYFDEFGAKLTIMADVAEILKFKEYAEQHGRDDFHYQAITEQLRTAVRTGHDVQLHMHSSFFNAQYKDGRWIQDWSEYNLANLSPQRIEQVITQGKNYLTSLLTPVKPDYQCIAFRAANWSMNPARNITAALIANDIKIDTSVFKFGRRHGLVNFDYSDAHHRFAPWRANRENICRHDPQSPLWEYPIYCEMRGIASFITPNRIYRALQNKLHPFKGAPSQPSNGHNGTTQPKQRTGKIALLTQKHPWKADFNQCSGRQIIQALLRAEKQCANPNEANPFVMIGHSKLFTRVNERSLRPFLAYVAQHPDRFAFARFADVHKATADTVKC